VSRRGAGASGAGSCADFQGHRQYARNDGAGIGVFLRTPHRNMPNLVISDSDRDNVIAYILSLRDKR
jgi:hypothetical protein